MTRNAKSWWAGEQALPIGLVPQHLPPRGNGQPVSVSRVYAWTTAGLRGVRLRRFRSPSGWCTTLEELQRFTAALTAMCGEEVGAA